MPSDAKRAIAGCGWPISHGGAPSLYDASQAIPSSVHDWLGTGHRTDRQRFPLAPASLFLFGLSDQVPFITNFFDLVHLRLKPVDVALFITKQLHK